MSSQSIEAIREEEPKIRLKRKPPFTPETVVDLRSHPEGVDVVLAIRHPIRRIRRQEFDARYALTLTEAYNLYHRLGRALERQERDMERARKVAGRG